MEKEIRDILYERKTTAEKIARENLKKIFTIPHMENHWKTEKKLRIEKARSLALNIPFDDKLLNNEINFIDKLLKLNNLSREDLEPKYTCKKCEDTGLILGEYCDCVKLIQSELNMRNSNLKSFHSFEQINRKLFDSDEQYKIVEILKKWTQNPNSKKINITLAGGTGVGKTFLLECIANEFIHNKKNVLFTTAFSLNSDFFTSHISNSNDKTIILNKFLNPDVLIIDDLGTEPIYNNVTREYLYLILNQRMLDQKSTLISSNLTPIQLKTIYGDRCFSRIFNKELGQLLFIDNSDMRLKDYK